MTVQYKYNTIINIIIKYSRKKRIVRIFVSIRDIGRIRILRIITRLFAVIRKFLDFFGYSYIVCGFLPVYVETLGENETLRD